MKFWILCMGLGALLAGCYQPIIGLDSIEAPPGLESRSDEKISEASLDSKTGFFTFYKECSKNGATWIQECQRLGLESIYDAIKLDLPTTQRIGPVYMFFHKKEAFIIFKVFVDSKNKEEK